MKKAISAILSLVMILSVFSCADFSAFAAVSGDYTYTISNNKATITKYSGSDKDVVIPSELDGYGVTFIDYHAFYYCTTVKSIIIPDGVTGMGISAFESCTSLTSITLPDSLTGLNWSAFRNCTSLQSITIPDGIKGISNQAFSGCTSLKSISLPDSLASIANEAFYKCRALADITIPNSVTSIGQNAFYDCSSLKNLTIPHNVTEIGWGAFQSCSSITSITIPYGVTKIESSTFQNCSSLQSIIIPNSVTKIQNSAFSYCRSLTSITIPNSVTSIERSAFYDCKSLTSISIPDSITSIAWGVFESCKSLTSITIPNSVTSIGSDAFEDCTSLVNITIPNSVIGIGSDAFRGCTSLASITIPDSVTSIGDRAFESCTSLASIIIPDSVTSIGDSVFSSCSSLASITIPNSITGIGRSAFSNCTSLVSIAIPNSVKSIGNGAFSECKSLTSMAMPNGVASVGSYAFRSCTSLTSITIPNSVTSIGDSAFESCTSLTSITIPDSLTDIASKAFYRCAALTKVDLPNSVIIIGDRAFESCTSLASITIPNSVKSISDYAFYSCASLTSINMPDSLTSIGNYAFRYCVSLANITIPDSVKNIGSHAFEYCSALISITIPDSVTSIGQNAFYDCYKLEKISILNPSCKIYDSSLTINNTATIYGDIFSTAYEYAKTYKRTFKSILNINEVESISVGETKVATIAKSGDFAYYKFTPTEDGNYLFYSASTDDTYAYLCDSEMTELSYDDDSGDEYNYCISYNLKAGKTYVFVIRYLDSSAKGSFPVTLIKNPVESISISNQNKIIDEFSADYWFTDYDGSLSYLYDSSNIIDKTMITVNYNNGTTITKSVGECYDKKKDDYYIDGYPIKIEDSQWEKLWTVGSKNYITFKYLGYTSQLSITITKGAIKNYETISVDETKTAVIAKEGDIAYFSFTPTEDGAYTFSSSAGSTKDTYATLFDSGMNELSYNDDSSSSNCNFSITYYMSAGTTYYFLARHYDYFDKGNFSVKIVKSPTSNVFTYKVLGDGTAEITSYKRSDKILSIPERIDGYSVTSIGNSAFSSRTSLKSITIPNSVINIGTSAFNGCTALTSITIPNGVTTIGASAFYGCKALKNVTIPNSVTSIGDSAFYNCTALTSITISNGVTTIGGSAFYGCSALKNVTLPNSVTSIGDSAFYNCKALASITIPNSVISIGEKAFYGCSKLTSITIPNPNCTIYASSSTISSAATIYGNCGSTSHKYAQTYNRNFIVLPSSKSCIYDSVGMIIEPTCTTAGEITYRCINCDSEKTQAIAKLGHKSKPSINAATPSKDGKIVMICDVCSVKTSTTVIPKVNSITLSTTSYTYDGKVKKPSVTVKDSKGKALKSGTDYTVHYGSGRKNVGKYNVSVEFKGNYGGYVTKTFTIKPNSTSISSLTARSKGFKVKVKKQTTQTDFYQIQYSTDKNFKKNNKTFAFGVSGDDATSASVGKLIGKKKYYVRVRTYKRVSVNGELINIYSSWSSAKSVTTKK